MATHRQRFRIVTFTNRGGSTSWRVIGMKRDGEYVRQNFPDMRSAQCRQIELEAEFQKRQPDGPELRATTLTEHQTRLAEAVFKILDADEDLPIAVQFWREHGSQRDRPEAPRLDDAVARFNEWLDSTTSLRHRTKSNLRTRVGVFAGSTGNLRVSDIKIEDVEAFLDRRRTSPTTKDNDRRALSRFFAWCQERPRKWTQQNPAAGIKIERGDKPAPSVLSVDDCERLLRAAESIHRGALVPYVVATLFAGLRPFEASRVTWAQVNLQDGEIRLEGAQTKTGKPRVIEFNDGPAEQAPFNAALKRWLTACQGMPFYPPNWRRWFDEVKRAAGFGGRTADADGLKPWPEDVLRHTAVSHYLRLTGSYGRTADQFGNSEAIIKAHYKGRFTTEDTRRFYALQPSKG